MLSFVGDILEPADDRLSIFPLVQCCRCDYLFVNSLQYFLANDLDFRF